MKAALLRAPGDFIVAEAPTPKCPEGGLLIEVDRCSICSSDLKMAAKGHRDLVYPRILGHEVTGTVVAKDTRRKIAVGARVQVWPGVACGSCQSCIRGHDNLCDSIGIIGFNIDGGFAEYMAVPRGCVEADGVNLLPDSLSSEHATLGEPLACCINAQEAVRMAKGESVLVIGGGPLGALHAMLARSRGAETVIISECLTSRKNSLLKTGADIVAGPDIDSISKGVMSSTEGRGVDVLILSTSDKAVDASLLSLLAPRGRLSIFSGLPRESSVAPIDMAHLHYRELSIIGSYGCTSWSDRRAIELLARKDFDVSWLLTKEVDLEDIAAGMEHASRREGFRALVRMN